MHKEPFFAKIDALMTELIQGQQERLLTYGRMVIPTLTGEDLLQPCDYPELEGHPIFRYEEGVLTGIESAQAALRALMSEIS